jgi:hypothetical protein
MENMKDLQQKKTCFQHYITKNRTVVQRGFFFFQSPNQMNGFNRPFDWIFYQKYENNIAAIFPKRRLKEWLLGQILYS